MKNHLTVTSICISLFISFYRSEAAVYEYQYTPPSNVDPTGFADYRIFIPDDPEMIKGVYCYIPGFEGSSLEIVDDADYQNYVEEKNMALMGFRMLGQYTSNIAGVSLWSGEALIQALVKLAQLSGHDELEYSPLLFSGHSAGGQFAYHFTQWKPERVIAFVTMKGGYHSLSDAGDAIYVPGYLFTGEEDNDYRITNLTTIFETNRSRGALWALAVEPGAAHSRVSDDILHSFFDQIVPLRLPETCPENAIPELSNIEESSGWLGNRDTYVIKSYDEYMEDKTTACWFPNEKIADEWRKFVKGLPFSQINILNQSNPDRFILRQNFPNPFNPVTTIQYQLPCPGQVILNLYNPAGQKIRTLLDEYQQEGKHQFNLSVRGLSSGIYFYRLQFDRYLETKRITLQK